MDKAYRATLILGTATDSADIQGKVLAQLPYEHITRGQMEEVFRRSAGETKQVPPMVSAVKVPGEEIVPAGPQRHHYRAPGAPDQDPFS